jgi:antitoxin component of MazEF toxin-antitoxin module
LELVNIQTPRKIGASTGSLYVLIPSNLRQKLGITEQTKLLIFLENETIIIKKQEDQG